jgi:hypothetical protein
MADGFVRCPPHHGGYCPTKVSAWQPTERSYPVQVTDSTPPYQILSWIPPLPDQPSVSAATSFAQYIQTIPVWEQTLFSCLDFILPQYELSALLSQVMTTPAPQPLVIHFISDGSQIDDTTTFRWCLALSGGTCLVNCSGPGYGPGTSHRAAEGYSILSTVCFVARLQQYVDTSAKWPLRFSTDNKGLLILITQRLKYKDN